MWPRSPQLVRSVWLGVVVFTIVSVFLAKHRLDDISRVEGSGAFMLFVPFVLFGYVGAAMFVFYVG